MLLEKEEEKNKKKLKEEKMRKKLNRELEWRRRDRTLQGAGFQMYNSGNESF